MTDRAAAALNTEADVRWRAWQARGAEADRRTDVRMATLTVLIAVSLVTWLVVGLF